MPQKYAEFVLESSDLSLSDEANAVSKFFENICIDDGIKTKHTQIAFSKIVEPQRQTAIDEIIQNIGGLSAVFQYKTLVSGIEKDYLILCSCEHLLYYYELYKEVPQLVCFDSIALTDVPHFETFSSGDKNMLIISSKQDEIWIWDGENNPYEVLDSPIVTSSVIGLGRLFVTTNDKPYSVCYSEDLDPSTWSMSSGDIMEINFSDSLGKVISVVGLDNYVFAIRERGIVKIYTKANGDFVTSKIVSFSGTILHNSICECGDHIMFCSSAGIYKFDGINIKLIYKKFDVLPIKYENICAICKDDEYHLFTHSSDGTCGYMFVFHHDGKIREICKIELFDSVFCVDIFGVFYVGYIANENAQKNAKQPVFLSKTHEKSAENTNFMYKTNKIFISKKAQNAALMFIDVLTNTDVDFEVITNHQTKQLHVVSSEVLSRLMLNMRADWFQIVISGNNGADIDSLVMHYTYMIGR